MLYPLQNDSVMTLRWLTLERPFGLLCCTVRRVRISPRALPCDRRMRLQTHLRRRKIIANWPAVATFWPHFPPRTTGRNRTKTFPRVTSRREFADIDANANVALRRRHGERRDQWCDRKYYGRCDRHLQRGPRGRPQHDGIRRRQPQPGRRARQRQHCRGGHVAADIGNVALNLGNRSSVEAGGGPTPGGFGNLALNVCNTNQVLAIGGLNSALNIGGTGNGVVAEGVLNNATQVGGNARSPKRPRVSNSGKVRPVDVVSVTCGDPVVWAGALPGSKWRRLRSGH
jgi:hypothetical protein